MILHKNKMEILNYKVLFINGISKRKIVKLKAINWALLLFSW